VISSGRPVAEIARVLGVNEGTIGNWMSMAKQRGEVTEKPLTMVSELAKLGHAHSSQPGPPAGAGPPG
jgi:transposase-like protein